MSDSESSDYKYWAFISYSHQDNLAVRGDGSGDHIPWANWLHDQLETYRVPDGYSDRLAATGEPMPERFFPAFRDEAELPTSHDLGGQIHDALRRSRFLIVIASPRSAASRYVNEEVRYFRQLGRGNRILTLIVDGEPNVRLHPKAGWAAGDDCFCLALVHPLRADGSVDETVLLPEEPIAADVRVKEAEPPREMRAPERTHSDRQGLIDFMKLKLIAGLMGVGLDELVQRDKRRAEEQLKRSRQELSRTEFLFARHLLDLKDYPKAYARLSKSLADDPGNCAAATLGLEEIRVKMNRGALRQYHCEGAVRSAVFSPDGVRVLTASGNTARLWDAASGRPLAEPLCHDETVVSAVFSPDGSRVLTASWDKTARLWDAASGRPSVEPLRHEGWVNSAVFSPDGARILTASNDNTARLWDATSGRPLAEPLRHAGWVLSAVFSPDSSRILTASNDKTARLWHAASGHPSAEPLRHEGWVNSAVFSSDGSRILTASDDKTARLWHAASGRPLAEPLRHEGRVSSAVFSPDGSRILTASDDKTARLWDAASGRPLAEPLRHENLVSSAVFSPDGAWILTASGDNTTQLWDAASGRPLAEPLRHAGGVRSAVFSPDSSRILTASDDKTARLWDAASGRPLAEPLRHEDTVWSAVFSPDDARILTASGDILGHSGYARLWDAASGRPLGEPLSHEGWVNSAVFSPDGVRILTASEDKTARLWDAASGRPLAEPMRHEDMVWSAVFSPDGARILTASGDIFSDFGYARLWDAASGRPFAEPLRHEGWVNSAVFSPDGARILTASGNLGDSTPDCARLWDAASGRPLAEPMLHAGGVRSAVFSPDGMRILTASGDNTAQLWDAASGRPSVEPLRHEGWVNSAVFSLDGARILTASDDKTARLWDAASGRPLAEPMRHEGSVRSAVFSPDGLRILTASEDKTARIWDAASGKLNTDDSSRLRSLLEITGTRRLNAYGLTEPVPTTEVESLRHDLDAAVDMDRLLRWWWADPFSRTIHPSSSLTVPNFVRRRINEVLDNQDDKVKASALQDALNSFPHHPLVLLCLAEQGKHGDPEWLAQYAVSRLLAEPHYLTPLQSRMTDADHAARAHELTLGLSEDCHLGGRLLQRQNRPELAKKVIARACKLSPENETYRQLASQL
jgi:WD40 repeat protein